MTTLSSGAARRFLPQWRGVLPVDGGLTIAEYLSPVGIQDEDVLGLDRAEGPESGSASELAKRSGWFPTFESQGEQGVEQVKKIVVTGGAGFIGSHTVVDLVENGFEPVLVDNFSNSDRGRCIAGLESICGRPFCDLTRSIAETGTGLSRDLRSRRGRSHGVIHFAASKAVGESQRKTGALLREQSSAPSMNAARGDGFVLRFPRSRLFVLVHGLWAAGNRSR